MPSDGDSSRSRWLESALGLSLQTSAKRAAAVGRLTTLPMLCSRLRGAGVADRDRRGMVVSASRAVTAGGRARGGRIGCERRPTRPWLFEMSTGRDVGRMQGHVLEVSVGAAMAMDVDDNDAQTAGDINVVEGFRRGLVIALFVSDKSYR